MKSVISSPGGGSGAAVVFPRNANSKGWGERLFSPVNGYYAGSNGNFWVDSDVYWPFYIPVTIKVDLITWKLTGGNSGGRLARLAVYENVAEDTVYPGARLIYATEADCSSLGWKDYTPGSPVELEAGVYWYGMNTNNAALTYLALSAAQNQDSSMWIGYNKNEIDGGLQGPGAYYVARAYDSTMPSSAAAGMGATTMAVNGIPLALFRRYVP